MSAMSTIDLSLPPDQETIERDNTRDRLRHDADKLWAYLIDKEESVTSVTADDALGWNHGRAAEVATHFHNTFDSWEEHTQRNGMEHSKRRTIIDICLSARVRYMRCDTLGKRAMGNSYAK